MITLSTKNQIVVPKEARHALGLKAGDQLLVTVRGSEVIVLKKPEQYHTAIRGLARSIFPPGYLEEERNNWD